MYSLPTFTCYHVNKFTRATVIYELVVHFSIKIGKNNFSFSAMMQSKLKDLTNTTCVIRVKTGITIDR